MRNIGAFDYAAIAEPDLAQLARGGDPDAFRAIMQRCNQRLFRLARAVLRDDDEAEDVLQEAYTRAFAAIEGFRGDSSLSTWLTRIVLNEAHGGLKRRRPTAGLEALEAEQEHRIIPFPGAALGDNPEAHAAHAQIRRIVERALDELPEPFRLVFILREVEELSVDETAVQLDLMKTRLHHARRRLRGMLQAQLSDVLTGAYPFLGVRCAV